MPPPKAGHVQQLIADLDSDDFATREKASQALAKLGSAATAALRRTLADNPSAEVRRRVQELLKQLPPAGPSADLLRELRAVEVLERIGSPGAAGCSKRWPVATGCGQSPGKRGLAAARTRARTESAHR